MNRTYVCVHVLRFRPLGQIGYYKRDNCHGGAHTFGRRYTAEFGSVSERQSCVCAQSHGGGPGRGGGLIVCILDGE